MLITRRAAVAGLAGATAARRASAQAAYPTRSLRLIVPYAAGGQSDVVARILGEGLGRVLGQSAVVENRTGAGGIIGTEAGARAEPDGYSLTVGTIATHAIIPVLQPKVPYDHMRDFAPVALLIRQPLMLAVTPSLPVQSLDEFLAYAKAGRGPLSFGSSGIGTSLHLAGEMFKLRTGAETMEHVPYRGSGPMMNDLIAGQIQLTFDAPLTTLPFVQNGQVRGIAVTSPTRLAAAPDLPAVAERLPGFDVQSWTALFAPARTPQPVLDRLNAAVREVWSQPEVQTRLRDLGAEPAAGTAADLGRFVASETDKWREVVREANVRP
ncbi:Bug family tripartite tricarboxylate transporter substrate binding protein [Muricoccus aerilatus]|uniref:Bug family tripartite tricarboxylate transporter substrate binding protein n=1 Tax=Muricoccus aerilatus TaxID=452982 RepID=UPI0005C1A0DD|nr:tripartite tricarboxylate transporter substrate binding protein [Roseomonas aerilata]